MGWLFEFDSFEGPTERRSLNLSTGFRAESPIFPGQETLHGAYSANVGPDSIVLTETGDSWFNGMKLRLPEGAKFEIQMAIGSIATLGLAWCQSHRRDRRWFLPVERARGFDDDPLRAPDHLSSTIAAIPLRSKFTMVPITTSRTGMA